MNFFGSSILQIINLEKLGPWDLYDLVKVHSQIAFISKVGDVYDSAIVSDKAIFIVPFFTSYFVIINVEKRYKKEEENDPDN